MELVKRVVLVDLVFVGERSCDEECRQQSDDVCLEALDHKLKEGHADSHCKREWGEDLHEEMAVMQHVIAAGNKYQEKQVAGEHICEETERERQWANQEEGCNFNRGKKNVNRLGHARHKCDSLEVLTKSLLLYSYIVEDKEGEER